MTKSRLFVVALLAAFVFGCQAAPASTAGQTPKPSASATATPTKQFWSEKGLLLTAGDFGHPDVNGDLAFADSEIVRLPDGRFRIYMYIGSPSGSGPGYGIGSMVSADGLHWTLEPGNRCSQTCGQIAVVQMPGGGWRIFGTGEVGIRSATSADGLIWKDDPGFRISNVSFPISSARFPGSTGGELRGPHITPVSGGGWRMYFHQEIHFSPPCGPGTGTACPGFALGQTPARILSAFSNDLVNWTPDPGIRATAGLHPNVKNLPTGGYQMFANPGFDLVTAKSQDGLTWPAAFSKTWLQGGDPDPVVMADGSIRLYYNDADFLSHRGGGLYWADLESATWDVTFEGSTTVKVTGTGKPVTVTVTDRGRSGRRPVNGLPHTARPPFQISFSLPQDLDYQPLVEVSDGTMNRYFDAYNLPSSQSQPAFDCDPQNGIACPPPNCGYGTGTVCPIPCSTAKTTDELPCSMVSHAPPCKVDRPIGNNGCIAQNPSGQLVFCPSKNAAGPEVLAGDCKPYYTSSS